MTHRVGFDVGGTNARIHIFDGDWTTISERRERIRDSSAPEEIVTVLLKLLRETCKESNVDLSDVKATGIGLAGQLSTDGRTVLNAPNLGWRDVDFVDVFATQWRTEMGNEPPAAIRLCNDLNAQLWGEYIKGAVRGIDDVLALFVGTGVGGAILSEGRLVTGADGNAGEIGHSKVVVGGRPCGCGESGCVEAYAGGIHLERRLAAMLAQSEDSTLASLRTDEGINPGAADALADTHPAIAEIWEEATDYLAIVAANAITLLNPRALLIGGGILENCTTFRSLFLQKTIPLVLQVSRTNLQVEQASLGDLAGVLGAAALAELTA